MNRFSPWRLGSILRALLALVMMFFTTTGATLPFEGKNRKVLLMMMRAFDPSAATASEATTTSGLGSGFGSGSQSKIRRRYLKLILCCFLPNSCPHTKFHPNWTKNIEVKMISYRLASVAWSRQ